MADTQIIVLIRVSFEYMKLNDLLINYDHG